MVLQEKVITIPYEEYQELIALKETHDSGSTVYTKLWYSRGYYEFQYYGTVDKVVDDLNTRMEILHWKLKSEEDKVVDLEQRLWKENRSKTKVAMMLAEELRKPWWKVIWERI